MCVHCDCMRTLVSSSQVFQGGVGGGGGGGEM